MPREVILVDSQLGNLDSVEHALIQVGASVIVSSDPDRVATARMVVFPGQGSFGPATQAIVDGAMGAALRMVIERGDPFLGICLGMQLLFARSEEEDTRCLGVIDAEVRRFPDRPDLPVPQMGWNELEPVGSSPLLAGLTAGAYAYFVHSYAAPVGPYTRAVTTYGVPFSAVVEQGNFFGTQFHPERSSRVGAQVLENFLKITL